MTVNVSVLNYITEIAYFLITALIVTENITVPKYFLYITDIITIYNALIVTENIPVPIYCFISN